MLQLFARIYICHIDDAVWINLPSAKHLCMPSCDVRGLIAAPECWYIKFSATEDNSQLLVTSFRDTFHKTDTVTAESCGQS